MQITTYLMTDVWVHSIRFLLAADRAIFIAIWEIKILEQQKK
jgi:hypothetical protein